jgi:uncharacterized protein YegL
MGAALSLVAQELKIPLMPERAFPPVLVLVSDGQPTDDFSAGLKALMNQPWGRKAVRLAIAIGQDADDDCLQRFVGNKEIPVFHADGPTALLRYVKWVSTEALKSVSSPMSYARQGGKDTLIPVSRLPEIDVVSPDAIW